MNSNNISVQSHDNGDDWRASVVSAFYRTILGREADLDGLNHHRNALIGENGKTSVDAVLLGFMGHAESKRNLLSRSVGLPGVKNTPPRVVRNVVSLGTHCYTSFFLKRFGLKRFSSSFDWTFASPGMVAHAIGDDFETFLDQRHYVPVPIDQRVDGAHMNRVQHAFYRDHFGVNFVFNHHDVHEEADYAYMTRCTQRMRDCLKDGANTLFLMIRSEDERSFDDFRMVKSALKKVSPECAFVSVVVAPVVSEKAVSSATECERDGDSVLLRFEATSAWEPLQFNDPFDEAILYRSIFHEFRPTAEGV